MKLANASGVDIVIGKPAPSITNHTTRSCLTIKTGGSALPRVSKMWTRFDALDG